MNQSGRIIVVLFLCMIFLIPAFAQSKEPSNIADLQKEIARLKKELAVCKEGKTAATNIQRTEAIASLRAVKSALDTGANLEEFKKYQIESRIKVDALPDTPENAEIKEISDLYKDAVSFSIIRLTGEISQLELDAAKDKYKDNEHISKGLGEIEPGETGGLQQKLNQEGARYVSALLVITANKKLSALK